MTPRHRGRRAWRDKSPTEKVLGGGLLAGIVGATIVFSPFILSFLLLDGGRRIVQNKWARRPPRIVSRRRPLSPPRAGFERSGLSPLAKMKREGRKERLDGQLGSLFFRLPAELRNAVYRAVVEAKVHVVLWDGRLLCFPCLGEEHCVERFGGGHCWVRRYRKDAYGTLQEHRRPGIGVLGLLRSCRQIYTELIDLVYSQPVFQFYDYFSVLAFSSAILPARFNAIRAIHLNGRRNGEKEWPSSVNTMSGGKVFYRPFRKLTARNPVLPVLDPHYVGLQGWTVTFGVIQQMQGLKQVRIDLEWMWIGPYIGEANTPGYESFVAPLRKLEERGIECEVLFDRLPDSCMEKLRPYASLSTQRSYDYW